MTRDQLVKSLVEEYRKSGKDAAVKLFDQSIKRFEISQYGIKTIITEFRDAIAKDDKVGRTAIEGTPQCVHCDKLAVFSYKQVPICERCLSTVSAYADVKLRELEAL